jgi:hypothetical protein
MILVGVRWWVVTTPRIAAKRYKEENIMQISPKTAYHNLRLLESVDAATSAIYRQLAQEVLANPDVTLVWRMAIANRLNRANHLLGMQTVTDNDSY